MMEHALSFIKKHRFDIIVTCAVIAFIYDAYFNKHTFTLTIVALFVLGYAADAEKSQTNIAERKRLLPKGLTQEDIKNIKFVKAWDETRKTGLVKYTVVYGGIFYGIAFCFGFCLLNAFLDRGLMNYISGEPANMVKFIAQNYVGGALAGIIVFRLIWSYNEKKFIRLTDPLH